MLDAIATEAGGTPQPDSSPTGLVPIRAVVPGADSKSGEAIKPPTISEVIDSFAARRLRIKIFKESRILFDPKQLPRVTPEESLDFLLKGVKIEGDEADQLRKILDPHSESGRHIRGGGFLDFIDSMTEQNRNRAIAEIWAAADADDFTKLALQWEIRNLGPYGAPDHMEEFAAPVAADLRKMDTLLRSLRGKETFLQCVAEHENIYFAALITPDGNGMGFVPNPNDLNSHDKEVVLGGQTAFSEKWACADISTGPHLIIPYTLRKVLRTRTPETWDDDGETFWRSGRCEVPFDLDNPFPGVMTDVELTQQREQDGGLSRDYDKLKNALDQSSPTPAATT